MNMSYEDPYLLDRAITDAKTNIAHLRKFGAGGTFLDAGANIGEVANQAAKQFDKVIAIEAHPITYRIACKRIEADNVELLNKAVWSSNDEVLFASTPGQSTGSTTRPTKRLKNCASDYYHNVVSVNFQDLLDEHKPRVIKIDIEGAEFEVLKDCRFNKECEFVTVEFHGVTSEKKYEEYSRCRRNLEQQGFKAIYPSALDNIYVNGKKKLFFVAIFQR